MELDDVSSMGDSASYSSLVIVKGIVRLPRRKLCFMERLRVNEK